MAVNPTHALPGNLFSRHVNCTRTKIIDTIISNPIDRIKMSKKASSVMSVSSLSYPVCDDKMPKTNQKQELLHALEKSIGRRKKYRFANWVAKGKEDDVELLLAQRSLE